ncbi:sigma-70 family RNA polymerase sigma factor [Myxococcus sp. K15C18031901]|uniref:RNA polymerase sigma factor n=1 Tax=Myxococcus dinghuensis TaxID=2906761 RepID=UPI0020A740C4|nr:sigma-70 family RNA polymerase sigma factor [Myxococcus dinghuensis]MCP3101681.1 sigma-70 family RNA polymerase sigma factor [Myxococcus dinghuensis]
MSVRNPGQKFITTRWSLIAAATGGEDARAALATLCEVYWPPCYAFVRRNGHDADAALDLTQGFFTRLLEGDDLSRVDRERGRFRSWLLAALKHHLVHDWRREQAQKRGGGAPHLSIDADAAESQYNLLELSHDVTPERLFERHWALSLLERALAAVREEWRRMGKSALFERLAGCLTSDLELTSYQAIAADFGLTGNNVKVTVHRLRQRYRAALHEEISLTVESDDAVEAELRYLLAALG